MLHSIWNVGNDNTHDLMGFCLIGTPRSIESAMHMVPKSPSGIFLRLSGILTIYLRKTPLEYRLTHK